MDKVGDCMTDLELTHYGVKGMKWGVRKEYEPHPRKPGKKTTKPKNNKDLQKKIAIGAVATAGILVGIGAMYLYKKSKLPIHMTSYSFGEILDISALNGNDFTLKAGTKFKRISSEKVEDYTKKGRLYVSHLKKDNRMYKELMPKFLQRWEKEGIVKNVSTIYQHTITTKKDIKVPSERAMAEIYSKIISKGSIDSGKYQAFMEHLSDLSDPSVSKYLSAIKNAGYDAVQDLNDKSIAKSPLILIDPEKLVDNVDSRKVGKIERFINVLLL